MFANSIRKMDVHIAGLQKALFNRGLDRYTSVNISGLNIEFTLKHCKL